MTDCLELKFGDSYLACDEEHGVKQTFSNRKRIQSTVVGMILFLSNFSFLTSYICAFVKKKHQNEDSQAVRQLYIFKDTILRAFRQLYIVKDTILCGVVYYVYEYNLRFNTYLNIIGKQFSIYRFVQFPSADLITVALRSERVSHISGDLRLVIRRAVVVEIGELIWNCFLDSLHGQHQQILAYIQTELQYMFGMLA